MGKIDKKKEMNWLSRYANEYHAWRNISLSGGKLAFSRPLGLVELSFDADGTLFGGRADMNTLLTLEFSHTLKS